MKVNIVCHGDISHWILGKFARKLEEYLGLQGVEVSVEQHFDPLAEINHHIVHYEPLDSSPGIQTQMVTHIDSIEKFNMLQQQLAVANMGICMSRESMIKLANAGIPRSRLSFINPAHDELIKPRLITVGITCRVQEDGRKREYMLGELALKLDPSYFAFKIMGDGWNKYVELLKKKGFEVTYWNSFMYDEYTKLIPGLDYYLYMGQDEGQMGFLDAVAAGVETIVTPQGYHLDVKDGTSYSFSTVDELLGVFDKIYSRRKERIDSVADWSWQNYALKHRAVWEYLLAKQSNRKYYLPLNIDYHDGVHSIKGSEINSDITSKRYDRLVFKIKLTLEWLRHKYYLHIKNKS